LNVVRISSNHLFSAAIELTDGSNSPDITYRCPEIRIISLAIFAGGNTKSTQPDKIALDGIPEYFAVFSVCAKVMPPAALTACRPLLPSDLIPERMPPMHRSLSASASDLMK